MRKSSALALITTTIFTGGLLAACGTSPAASSPGSSSAKAKSYKVGLVTDTGGLNDHGFNHLAYLGLMQAKNQLGVTTSVVQSETESDYVPFLTNYAKQGYNLVIAVGFLMAQAVQQVSKEFPHTKFMIIDDEVPGPNVTSSLFETQQCGYLVGELAGLVQKIMPCPISIPIIRWESWAVNRFLLSIPTSRDFMLAFMPSIRQPRYS